MKNMNKIFNTILLISIIFIFNKGISLENKIIFKINNKSYTTIDYKNRLKYLNFIGDNKDIEEYVLINDYISSILFFEYYKKTKPIDELDIITLNIYKNIIAENTKNNKKFDYEIIEENIIYNLKLDYIRKSIIERIINDRLNEINNSKDEIDLLYNFTIEYINIKNKNLNDVRNQIKSLNLKNIEDIEILLNKNNIKYFKKKQELKNINNINDQIKSNILKNNYFFILNEENDNNITYVKIKKFFKTYDSLTVLLYSYRSQENININKLNCSNLMKNNTNVNIESNEYDFIKLNSQLRKKLININDFVKFVNENEIIYVVLCDIKYNLETLKEYSFNSSVNNFAKKIEKNFIEEFSKNFNLILYE